MRFAKINRAGYPANVICKVLEYGVSSSKLQLPSGEEVSLFNAFLYQDFETKKLEIQTKSAEKLARSNAILSKPKRRR